MRNYKEIAKTNRFVANVAEICDISLNKHPFNDYGDVVDVGVALDMYVAGHKIDRKECFEEYHEFRQIVRDVHWKLSVIIDALNE